MADPKTTQPTTDYIVKGTVPPHPPKPRVEQPIPVHNGPNQIPPNPAPSGGYRD